MQGRCAVGSYKVSMRELDFELLGRALLVVETLEAAREVDGDLIQAIEAGVQPEEGFARSTAHSQGAALAFLWTGGERTAITADGRAFARKRRLRCGRRSWAAS